MISIVTAYYNRKKLFVRTLNSMKPYFGKINFEVIAVDDGSDEIERLEDLQLEFPFLRIIRLEKDNKWYVNSCIPFNIGFSEIRGDKVIIQNPECYHFNAIIEYVDQNLINNTYLSFGCFSLDKNTTNNDLLISNKEYIKKLIFENDKTFVKNGDLGWYNHSVYRPKSYHFCTAITKDDLYDLGGFDERYAKGVGYDDDEFIWRIKAKKMKINFIDNYIVLHQNHYNLPNDQIETKVIIEQLKESYKRNKIIFEDITLNSNLYKVNYLVITNTKGIIKNVEENYFFEFNKLIKKIIQNKFKRKIGILVLKLLTKL